MLLRWILHLSDVSVFVKLMASSQTQNICLKAKRDKVYKLSAWLTEQSVK